MAKILIAEDDSLLVKLYSTIFKAHGYEVEIAFDGEEAFKKLIKMEEKPTIILSDIMMPKVNGLDLLEKLKKTPELKSIPVVMLTNLSEEKDAERALSLGAVTYLVKSQYEPKEIAAKVREIISAYSRDSNIPEPQVAIKKTKK